MAIPDFETLFREYRNKVYWLAFSLTRNQRDAEDVLQNTFIQIVKHIGSFRGRSKLSTWIYRIAYNESLMLLRKARRQLRPLLPLDEGRGLAKGFAVDWSKLPDEVLLEGEFKERIDAAIRDIPLMYRMPLLLHQSHGLSVEECAHILHLKPQTVKARLHRAYLKVKTELDGYFKDQPERQITEDAACGLWQGFVRRLSTGALKRSAQESFQKHISDCPGCRVFLTTYRQAIRITGALECRDVPPELIEKIRAFTSSQGTRA